MMRSIAALALLLAGCAGGGETNRAPEPAQNSPLSARAAETSKHPGFLRWSTNGAGVFAVLTNPPPVSYMTNSDGIVRQRPYSRLLPRERSVFDHYLPETLNHLIWTNFIAHTNGRGTLIWSVRQHSPSWPTNAPVVAWNRNSLMWGMKGLTALSPCWEGEGNPGQVPITALTRRHGYTRGHSMGPDGFRTELAGKKVWFVTTGDVVVQATVQREVVRTLASGRDYTLLLFDKDLPDTIQPVRVAASTNVLSMYRGPQAGPMPLFCTEQGGQVGPMVPGYSVQVSKGGDSGSPNLLPLPGELVFLGGRSTSGPSREMQAEMDELCRLSKLPPQRYQMQWVDLSGYPTYAQ
jgi:hypothetical protein